MANNEKLFSWQNIQSFVRGIIEPHTQAVNMRLNEYIDFNDKRHEEFKNDINTRFNQFKQWTETELANLRTWTQKEIKYLKDTLIDEETGKLKYEVIPVNQLVEVGTIMAWPVAIPMVDKYLYCDGSKIPDGAQYYQLKEVLGSDYVPDYRGLFLRGYGSHKSTHYVSAEDTEQGYTLHQSAELGIPQGDAIRVSSTKGVGRFYSGDMIYDVSGIFKCIGKGRGGGNSNGKDGGYVYGIELDLNYVLESTANETRPMNVAVNYYIRAIGG